MGHSLIEEKGNCWDCSNHEGITVLWQGSRPLKTYQKPPAETQKTRAIQFSPGKSTAGCVI